MPELVGSVVRSGRMSGLPQPVLVVDALRLRPFCLGDAPTVARIYADDEVQQWHARSMTVAEAAEWIENAAWAWARETGANWAVVDQHDQVVGRAGFRSIDLRDGVAEVAYWTAPSSRGNNIAPRAVDAVSVWMFENVGLHRIELNHSTRNTASCRVAQKAGFLYEGTRREQVLHGDGWHDMHVHGRLDRDVPVR